jgi:UDP-GlcNAc:undecaprenyl-phosphate GlcNAc-1-phosphate transferase
MFGLVTQVPVLLACALLMFLTGLIDDLINLKPSTKLIVQIALGAILLFFNYRLNWIQSVTLDSLLTLVWVVGMTNAFNLLDNMDGLCAGVALIVGAALLIDLLPGSSGTAFADVRYLALLLGATGGFRAYNINPASIFMGDSGSLLLGFSFAAVTLSSSHEGAGRSDILSIVAAPLLVLMIPIFDTTLVTLSRLLSGRSAAQGGRDHSSHRLVAIEALGTPRCGNVVAAGGNRRCDRRGCRLPEPQLGLAGRPLVSGRHGALCGLPGRHPRI